jgi:hypothetical protein
MGRDIHWVVERKHSDGAWESVLSQFGEYVRNGGPYGNNLNINDPGVFFSMRDDYFFEALTDFDERNIEAVTLPDLPDDASDYAKDHLERNEDLDVYERCASLYGYGWCSLGRLRDAAAGRLSVPSLADKKNYDALKGRVSILEDLLERDKEKPQILRGRTVDQHDGMFNPDMVKMSSHQALRLSERAQSLLPITGETVRLLVGYDS